MKFAVIGSSGMFGKDMQDLLVSSGHESTGLNRGALDLANIDSDELKRSLEAFDVVINAAAYTDVAGAESNEVTANAINAKAVGELAKACNALGNRFIHISTDYVFDGLASSPYCVGAAVNPLNAYGRSKALGEQLLAEAGGDAAVVRTSWLYGSSGRCFPKTIATRLLAGEPLEVVEDQVGQPTWTRDLAAQILKLSRLKTMPKVAHSASTGQATWFEFAKAVEQSLGLTGMSLISSRKSSDLEPVSRPKYSVLDTSESGIVPIGDWHERWNIAAEEILAALGNERA